MKIAILGAESTGKTALANFLSSQFQGLLIPEFARVFIDSLDRVVQKEDVLHIAHIQISEYNAVVFDNNGLYVFDTALLTSIVWLEDKFDVFEKSLWKKWKLQKFDIIFLCKPDLPWEYDPQREDEHRLEELHEKYKILLKRSKKEFTIIDGFDQNRSNKALLKVQEFINTKSKLDFKK